MVTVAVVVTVVVCVFWSVVEIAAGSWVVVVGCAVTGSTENVVSATVNGRATVDDWTVGLCEVAAGSGLVSTDSGLASAYNAVSQKFGNSKDVVAGSGSLVGELTPGLMVGSVGPPGIGWVNSVPDSTV